MFRAIGVGYSRSLPSAAALNWVLKDGLGRLSRCIYTASFASAFDTNLKVWLCSHQIWVTHFNFNYTSIFSIPAVSNSHAPSFEFRQQQPCIWYQLQFTTHCSALWSNVVSTERIKEIVGNLNYNMSSAAYQTKKKKKVLQFYMWKNYKAIEFGVCAIEYNA